MKRTNFINYLDQRIEEKLGDFDLVREWDARNHSIEIIFTLDAENRSGEIIEDTEGTEIEEEEVINFEDAILLIHPEKSLYDAEDYLAVLPYDAKKGLSKGFINGLVDYLVEVLEDGLDELLDFLGEDSEEEEFELNWDAHDLQVKVDEYADELDEYLPYPKF